MCMYLAYALIWHQFAYITDVHLHTDSTNCITSVGNLQFSILVQIEAQGPSDGVIRFPCIGFTNYSYFREKNTLLLLFLVLVGFPSCSAQYSNPPFSEPVRVLSGKDSFERRKDLMSPQSMTYLKSWPWWQGTACYQFGYAESTNTFSPLS